MRHRITTDFVADDKVTREDLQNIARLVATAANMNINILTETGTTGYFEAPKEKFPKARLSRVDKLRARIVEQRAWMANCGGDLPGYIASYGSKADPEHSGDGGEAIYAADRAALDRMLEELATAVGPIEVKETEAAAAGQRIREQWNREHGIEPRPWTPRAR